MLLLGMLRVPCQIGATNVFRIVHELLHQHSTAFELTEWLLRVAGLSLLLLFTCVEQGLSRVGFAEERRLL